MMDHIPPSMMRLIKELQQVPYLASKNLYRVVQYFLEHDDAKVKQLCAVLLESKSRLSKCAVCCSWKEKDQNCLFCGSTRRNRSVICVVETWQDLMVLEKSGGYHGLYHVLGGAICPLDGIGPENLTVDRLVSRITDEIKEIILAMNQTPEGEATAAYIAHKVQNKNIIISCLARGMPVGARLDLLDRLTVYKALAERRHY